MPVLAGHDRAGHEHLFWEHFDSRAIRRGDWKAVWDRNEERWELFDLAADRTETIDLSSERPDVVGELATAWDAWAEEVGVWPKRVGEEGRGG